MMRLRRLPLLLLPLLVLACSDSTAPEDEEFGGQQLQLSVVGPQAVSQAEIDALGAAFDRVDEYRVIIADAGTEEVFVDTSIPIPANSPQHNLDIDVPDEALGRTVTITLIAFDEGMELYRSVQTATLNEGVNAPIDVDAEIRYTGPGIRGVISGDEGALEAGVTVNLMIDQSIVDAVQTEDDGTYLFLDVDQGAYTVQPTPPLGEVICPGAKDVTISTGDEAIEANFRTDDECFVHMLVLSGGDFDDTPAVEAMLELDSGINALTFFHVNTLPGVDFLTNFDVVLVMMNGLFDESAALGDQLAEYVNRGGSLVTASFYYQGHSGSNLGSAGWGALEQLDPLSPRSTIGHKGGGVQHGHPCPHKTRCAGRARLVLVLEKGSIVWFWVM
ncbi:MAG: hypothetical protein AAF389_11205, partial [Gemmatimonadota bacterium]